MRKFIHTIAIKFKKFKMSDYIVVKGISETTWR